MIKYIWICLSLLMACKAQQQTNSTTTTSPSPPTMPQFVTEIPSSAQKVSFDPIKEGKYCGYTESGNLFISDSESWNTLWTKVGSNQIPPPDLPTVDFSESIIIASFMGPQTSGGYSLHISSVQVDNSVAYVTVLHRKPGENCFVTDAITQPFSLIKVEKSGIKQLAFLIQEETNEC